MTTVLQPLSDRRDLHFIHQFAVNWTGVKCGFLCRRIRVAFRRVSMTALYVRGLVWLRPLYWLAMVLSVAAFASRASADPLIFIEFDQAKVIKIPDRTATIVLGDPFIADVSIQPGGIAVITGKSFGDTNMLVLDKSGAVLNEQNIRVRGPVEPTVVVYRGINRETYSCSPGCQPHAIPGDEQSFFSNSMSELTGHNSQALGAGGQGK
jgi:hypothetical protein